MEYTEHKKLEVFSREQMEAIQEFCEYLDGNVELKFVETTKPDISSSEDALFDFLGVDRNKLEKERKHMITNTKLSSNFIKLLLCAVLFSLISCKEYATNEIGNKETVSITEDNNKKITGIGGGNEIYEIEIDSCEYIVFDGYKAGGIVHKQNCKFCLQRYAK